MKAVAIAILYESSPPPLQSSRLLMQLRDLIPGIVYPGHWGLFGGHLEPDEAPEIGLRRELIEEIGYHALALEYFGNYGDDTVHRYVFTVPLSVNPDMLVLQEGWDMALLSWDELKTGYCYSHKAKQMRPVGRPHLNAIADFFAM